MTHIITDLLGKPLADLSIEGEDIYVVLPSGERIGPFRDLREVESYLDARDNLYVHDPRPLS